MSHWFFKAGLLKAGCLLVGIGLLSWAHAAPPSVAELEIGYLLQFIRQSGCEFYRNGRWYSPAEAQVHLRDKYKILSAANQILTAEDFIEKAATKSSLSGLAYRIRCPGTDPVPTRQWLLNELSRYRTNASPRVTRGDAFDWSRLPPSASIVFADSDLTVN